ncbi:hypothetical protein PVAND_007321 [Polypedilum vanderplanki]|uniref:Uncharacterized protein n=1 Tax=Polypedilum vanderplanki TaxID=319348 RepID=A0A9J6C5X4_POLVA|nr:hypothetical protein PVAND_007321 [Polypedilum vanderplanki]
MSSNHGLRFSQFTSSSNVGKKIMSAAQQPQQQTPALPVRQRKSATPTNTNIPVLVRDQKTAPQEIVKNSNFSDTDDEQDYFEDETDVNLSKEERFVLLQPRAEPQGQENLSGNVTPVNDNQQLNIYEKVSSSQQQQQQPTATKVRYSSASTDATNTPPPRFTNRSVSVDLRSHNDNSGSQRNSLILQQQQQQHSNRNSMDHSNRSSLDVSQSSYSTLIIHDNNESNPGLIKHDLYFINSSPSPPNYNKKDKSSPRSLGNYAGHLSTNEGMTPITENEQQYLNQSYVLKHLAKEVKIPNVIDSTRDSGVSENNSSHHHQQHWSSENVSSGRSKSKSQPDLTKLSGDAESHESNNSTTNTLNFNDFEQLEVENTKLREQLNNCLMKVAKSQKLEQEVANIYRVHEELVQSCERRERLEKTARTRLQSDCRRFQELNRALREQVETLQQQLLIATTQQQQQLANTGRTQQDLLITQLIQQNKELVDANKRQYIEIQAQSATLEEQRVHINVLDSALKRLEEEVRQKQLYQKQLQTLISANERRDKLRLELENELSKDLNRTPTTEANLKWQLQEKNNQIMRLEAECSKFDQRNMEDERKLAMEGATGGQDTDRIISDAHTAQRKVNELQTRLKMVENRLAEKEKEDILRQIQEQKLYSANPAYNLLSNNDYTPSSSSIVSSTPTTPYYNATNYENLMPSANSSKTVSATSNSSFDALLAGAYSGLYHQQNYGPKLSSVPPNTGISPNTSCSSTNTMQHKHQEPSITSSSSASNYLNYDLDEQRKSIDDQLKKLDNQLLTKICCFPSNLLSKKPVLSEEMTVLTSSNNNSDAFLQNLAHMRNRETTPANSSNSGKNEEIVLLEKQGRSSQKLRGNNLAQISSTIGQNMNDISNIGNQSSESSKLPKILLPPRKDRQSSAPPSALPRPPKSLKPPKKIEYGRLSETDSNKSNSKSEYEMKTSSLKRNQSPVTSTGSKNFVDIKSELQMALNSTKNNPKNYGTIKSDTTNNITKIYYSNKPDFLSTKNYQRLPDSPSSDKRFMASGKKITFMRQSPQQQHQSREGSVSSGSNSRSSPNKIQPDNSTYQQLTQQQQRSRTRTPPKYLNLNPNIASGGKLNYISSSSNSSPTKPNLPSSSVLHHAFQTHAQSPDNWKQHQRANSGRSTSGENKYRIQF